MQNCCRESIRVFAMDIFHAFYFPVNAFYQLWQRVIASTVYIWWVDNAAAVQAGPLIKYSAYANEKILPSRPSRSPLYNEVDRDGSMVLIWKLVYERHHWHSAAALFHFFFWVSVLYITACKICKPKLKRALQRERAAGLSHSHRPQSTSTVRCRWLACLRA